MSAIMLMVVIGFGFQTNVRAASSTSTLTQANRSRLLNEAEQLAAQGKYGDAASRFESLAAQSSSADRDHFILKAARNAQLAGDDAKAQGLLDLSGKNLASQDSTLRTLVTAVLQLHANQPDKTIAELDQVPLPLPEEFAADLLMTRAQALFATGRIVPAVNTSVERERHLSAETELAQNRQFIWDNLKQAVSAGRDLSPPIGANRMTAGWLELAQLFGSSQRDPFALGRGLNDWRSRYPTHPGSSMLITGAHSPVVVRNAGTRIALLLPLSGRQQAAGVAIRDGFLAAALQTSSAARPDIQIFDTNETNAVDAYQHAIQAGASIVVGPLLKEDVEALASTQQVGVMTLALNVLGDAQPPPALMFQFALDPEEEARQVARRAFSEGHTRAIALTPYSEWGLRIQSAFAAELQAQGGTLVAQRSYDPASRDYVGLSKQLFASRKPAQARALAEALSNKHTTPDARDDYDYIFLAAQPVQAKQLRPALRFVLPDSSVPVYATSDSYEPDTINTDLDGLRFVDMPWVIHRDTDTETLYASMNRVWNSNLRSRSRLYGFGIDAFKLINWLQTPQPQLAAPLQGVTGLLALDQSGRVRRQADWAQIINGKPQVLPDVTINQPH
ncbi:MAG: penicillin-binding protein activator [Steroidobacteraceae bacterium]